MVYPTYNVYIYIFTVYIYIYIYIRYIYIYIEEPTKLYVKFNAIHKLGSSPIGYEGFVPPQAGQGEAKLNQSYNNFVGYAYIHIHTYIHAYIHTFIHTYIT